VIREIQVKNPPTTAPWEQNTPEVLSVVEREFILRKGAVIFEKSGIN